MLFNSLVFFKFFAIVFLLWLIAPLRFKWIILLSASAVFYGWEKPEYLLLLGFTISVTYFSALKLGDQNVSNRRFYLYLSLWTNLAVLIVFKYLGFFTEVFSDIYGILSGSSISFKFGLLLPIGISFYTFQSIGYILDVYYKMQKPEKHFGYFALFVSFFPQILSGPIGRTRELMPQIKENRFFEWDNFLTGINRFIWGLFKKLVIADRLSVYVNQVYENVEAFDGAVLWLATFLFAIQLYADFSAYTDMAIGIAKIFGIQLAENFDYPFVSKNVTEFWRRWHISLSGWLRDYLYTPIQFSKKKWKKFATVYAIFLTFFICGLWHGAKFTFVIFGLLQGLALTYEMLSREHRIKWSKRLPGWLYLNVSWLITFLFTLLSFVFFRANTTKDSLIIVERMLFPYLHLDSLRAFFVQIGGIKFVFSIFIVIVFLLSDKFCNTVIKRKEYLSLSAALLIAVLIVSIILFGTFEKVNFIYFQF